MSRTIRTLPKRTLRQPKYKHKLLAGIPRKQVVTDYDDKPVAALYETHRTKQP
jgi:hypothetical protein